MLSCFLRVEAYRKLPLSNESRTRLIELDSVPGEADSAYDGMAEEPSFETIATFGTGVSAGMGV